MSDVNDSMTVTEPAPVQMDPQMEAQAREQTGQRQVRLRIDEREMKTVYVNAFRTNANADEVVVDMGMNLVTPAGQGGRQQGEILFTISDRMIMNYYSAKRLAMMLSQVVRQHEQQFGELKLNAAERGRR